MNNNPNIFTRYATFDRQMVNYYLILQRYFEQSEQNAVLDRLLQDEQEWELDVYLDEDQRIQREFFLVCMKANRCTSIKFKFLSLGPQINVFMHIQFKNLQELKISCEESDQDHYDLNYSIQFLPRLNAPNLEVLDLSNKEGGAYSLRSFKKCKFPRLRILHLSQYWVDFKDYESLSEALCPKLEQINLNFGIDVGYRNNAWRAKMQSQIIATEFDQELHTMLRRRS